MDSFTSPLQSTRLSPMELNTFGSRLLHLRKNVFSITRPEYENLTKLSHDTIVSLELDRRRPRLDSAIRICHHNESFKHILWLLVGGALSNNDDYLRCRFGSCDVDLSVLGYIRQPNIAMTLKMLVSNNLISIRDFPNNSFVSRNTIITHMNRPKMMPRFETLASFAEHHLLANVLLLIIKKSVENQKAPPDLI